MGFCAPTTRSRSALSSAFAQVAPVGVHTGRGRRDAVHVRSRGSSDRLALAMLAGAVVGFLIGASVGLGSTALDAPVLMPFVGAAIGVLVAAIVVGAIGMSGARERGRQLAIERELAHQQQRREAHRGWADGIDLTAET